MTSLIASVETLIPLFGLMLVGNVFGRMPIWGEVGTKYLTTFVFYVALPPLLFRSLVGGGVGLRLDLNVLLSYFGGCLLVFASGLALASTTFSPRRDNAALFAMGTVFSNTVQLGIPLVLVAFGDKGVLPLSMVIAFNSIILIPLTSVIVESARGGGGSPARAILGSLKSISRSPIVLAILAGLLYSLTGLGLPHWFERFAKLLGDAATPCALFAVGAGLVSFRIRDSLVESTAITLFKLVLHPLIVWLLASHVFKLDAVSTGVVTVMAGLPVGVNVFILARHYEALVAAVSASILVSTALSAVTLGVLISWLGRIGG